MKQTYFKSIWGFIIAVAVAVGIFSYVHAQTVSFRGGRKIVETVSASVTGSTSLSLTLPFAPLQNESVLCFIQDTTGTGATITPPSGYTQFISVTNGTAMGLHAYYHTVGAAEGNPAKAFTLSPSQSATGTCVDFSGLASTPVLASVKSAVVTNGTGVAVAANTPGASWGNYPMEVVAVNTNAAITDTSFSNLDWSNSSSASQTLSSFSNRTPIAISGSFTGAPTWSPSAAGIAATFMLAPAPTTFTVVQNLATPSATATPVPTPNGVIRYYTKKKCYVGNSTSGAGGVNPGPAEDHLLCYIMEGIGSSPSTDGSCDSTASAAAENGTQDGCIPEYYMVTSTQFCDDALAQSFWNGLVGIGQEAAFIHTGSPGTSSNRVFDGSMGGPYDCPGGMQTYPAPAPTPLGHSYEANIRNAAYQTWIINNWFKGTSSSTPQSHSWVYSFNDNHGISRYYGSSSSTTQGGVGSLAPVEYTSLSDWRAAIGAETSAYYPYPEELNCCGAGGGSFGANNATGYSEGVQNYAVTASLICDNDTRGNLKVLLGEKSLFGFLGSPAYLRAIPSNWPIWFNTVWNVWSDPNCNGVNVSDLEFASDPQHNDNKPARMVFEAVNFLLTPNDGADRFMKWQYTTCITCTTEFPVYPEDELVFKSPIQQVGQWVWSGSTSSDGNGCYSGDRGGTHDLVKGCGVGNDSAGFSDGVYIREGTCYKNAVLIGNCAAVLNPTTTTVTLQSAWFSRGLSAYNEQLSYGGNGPLQIDPVLNQQICSPNAVSTGVGCNGIWATTTVTTSIPPCQTTSNMTSVCAEILLSTTSAATPTPAPTATPAPLVIRQSCVTTTTCNLGLTPVQNNLLVAIGFDGQSTMSCNTGWTLIQSVSATYDMGQSCYKVAGAGESATQTPFSVSGGGAGAVALQQVCTGDISCTMSGAPANGDLMVALGFNGINSFSCNTGWTQIQHVVASLDDGITCYRVASSESATVTPFSGTAADIESTVWDLSGQDATTPIDAHAGSEAATTSNTVTVTTTSTDAIVGGAADNTVATMTSPSGYTNDFVAGPCAATGFSCTFDHILNVAAGSNSATFTGSAGSHLTAMLVAIKPAAGGSSSAANVAGTLWEISGQASSGFIDAHAGAESAAAGEEDLQITPATVGDLILGGEATNQVATGVNPSNWSLDNSSGPCASSGLSCLFSHLLGAASGLQTIIWQFTSSTHPVTAVMVAIKGAIPSTPAPTPTPTPTPTPPPTNGATYDGCPVFTYTGVESTDPYNTDISGAAVDPNSATIIGHLPANSLSGSGGGWEATNTTTSGAATFYTVQTTSSHNPPLYNTTTEPWIDGFFIGRTNDKHATVLLTDTCVVYEAYTQGWTSPSGPLTAYSGEKWNLNSQFAQGPASMSGASMASDLPFLAGMIRWNGEMSTASTAAIPIKHALNFAFPTSQGISAWGYVFPASSATGVGDCVTSTNPGTSTCAHPMHYGEHLRLKSSVSCPTQSSNPQGFAICYALKHYGMFYADQGSAALYFDDADNQGATNPYNMTAINNFINSVPMNTTNWEVLTEPTVTCQSGHSGCI